MTTAFDAKGKIYTNVIEKEAIPVIIQTVSNRIEGNIHLSTSSRIKDELNSIDQFIAVTGATIFDLDGAELYHCGFLTLNRTLIIWLAPVDEIGATPEKGGG